MMSDMTFDGATRTEQPDRGAKRPTIAYLSSEVAVGTTSMAVWSGVVAGAQEHNLNLIGCAGGNITETQANIIYDLVTPEFCSGIVTWSLARGSSVQENEAMHARYQALPVVTVSRAVAGYPVVMADNYRGMREAITHLIETHGCRRLAFIRGPEDPLAEERHRAYLETLEHYDIPFNPALVTPSWDWLSENGARAVALFLDERGLRPRQDIDAIVAANDLMAVSALKALQDRSIRVPKDLAMVGFNNSIQAQCTIPSITSVATPLSEQGRQSVGVLTKLMEQVSVPEQVLIPTHLVIHQSCGCLGETVVQAGAFPPPTANKVGGGATFVSRHDDILQTMIQMVGISGETEEAAWADELLQAFIANLDAPESDEFLSILRRILRRVALAGREVLVWHGALSAIQRYIGLCQNPQQVFLLLGQARTMIGEIATQDRMHQQLEAERHAGQLRRLNQQLNSTFDVTQLTNILADGMQLLGIPGCYLALYENPQPYHYPQPAPEWSRLILAYDKDRQIPLETDGTRFPTHQILPEGIWPEHRRYTMILQALYFQDTQIGFVLFEVGPQNWPMYSALRAQISSALQGYLLFQEAQQARLAAEKADRIKTRLLANVSHELRTPLNIILGYSQDALAALSPYDIAPPQALLDDLKHIRNSADHQLRIVNDLLDLSRAEIDELDLYFELLDPRPLLQDAFQGIAHSAPESTLTWHLQLPERLPLIQADPVRLRQILLNLLSNACKFTEQGEVVLGAQVEPPHLHLWVQDTGAGISPNIQQRIFEPFVSAGHSGRRPAGIGLGLSITRRLVALHNGSMKLESQPGRGSTFHVYLPLPNLADKTVPVTAPTQSVLLLISAMDQPPAEIVELGQRQELAIQKLQATDDLDAELLNVQPAALVWDLTGANSGDWTMVRRLCNHPLLSQSPFILYGQVESSEQSLGLTSVLVKPADDPTLLSLINALSPQEITGPILIVDDDSVARQAYQDMIVQGLPGYPVFAVNDGAAALAAMADQIPSLVLLDLMMPIMDGFDTLDRMRADPRTQAVPVVILTSKVLNLDDIKRIEQHTRVVVQSKGILDDQEIITALHHSLFGAETLPPETSALVKRAVAYLHQNYARPLKRWEIAEAVGVSENYLSRVFSQELGLSPWDYLNRFRISRAKELLRRTQGSIKSVADQVGFKDQKYFSRVFHKLTDLSPSEFREQS
jgi:signal transduction histidine kinase/DNA-binding LacI/PurR family transcriptional regulator/AraC-like DNA-binding protein